MASLFSELTETELSSTFWPRATAVTTISEWSTAGGTSSCVEASWAKAGVESADRATPAARAKRKLI